MPEAEYHRQPVEQEISRGGVQRAGASALPGTHGRGGRTREMAYLHVSGRL